METFGKILKLIRLRGGKDRLQKEIGQFEERLSKKFATKYDLEEIEERIDKNARDYRDEILTGLDGVMGELKTMREETTIGTHQVSELRERVEDHEVRLSTLEKP